jgi:hypothetical protein
MDKKLQAYIDYIEKESKHPSEELIRFHRDQVQQFQHERLIHLIVTMFFALFMVIFFIFFFILNLPDMALTGTWGTILTGCIGVVELALLVVTLFYVRHYYQLENGTQKLEDYTRILEKRDYWKRD